MIRVLIADDQALVRGGFRMIIDAQPDMKVVGEAANGREAIDLAASTHPQVVLMDVRMPTLDGIQATRQLAAASPNGPRMLMLTTFDLDEYIYKAIRAGASGFLLKDIPPAELAHAIRVIAAGEMLLAPTITRRLVEEFVKRPPPGQLAPGLGELTPREVEVLKQLARGLSNAEIAKQLVLSETTVKTHVNPDPQQAWPPRPRTSGRARLRIRTHPRRRRDLDRHTARPEQHEPRAQTRA